MHTVWSRCFFPFEYNGVFYNECIPDSNSKIPFCSTTPQYHDNSRGSCTRCTKTLFSLIGRNHGISLDKAREVCEFRGADMVKIDNTEDNELYAKARVCTVF